MAVKQKGNRIIGVRLDKGLHDKLFRAADRAGVERSTILRSVFTALTDDQIMQLVTSQQGQKTSHCDAKFSQDKSITAALA